MDEGGALGTKRKEEVETMSQQRNKQQQPEGGTRLGDSDAFEIKVLKETTDLQNGLVDTAGGERGGPTEKVALT